MDWTRNRATDTIGAREGDRPAVGEHAEDSDGACKENPAVKSICLTLAVLMALSIVLAGCGSGNSLPYVGPINGGDGGSGGGGGTPQPPDGDGGGGGGTPPPPPPPPIDDSDGGLTPPSPPIF